MAFTQTLADTQWLQPWLDGVLKQQIHFDAQDASEVDAYLSPKVDTAKVGDGIAR